ncbi:MAG: ABC transporter substrate-binding protein [Methanothrix sp.]|jgi:iron complex transport system substrate-binding protein
MELKVAYILMCLCLLIFTGCAETVKVIDSTGRSVSVDTPVTKVVSLGTGIAEYVYILDEGESLVGRDSYSYFPPAMQNVTIAGKSSYSPDLELIIKLDPDLVIADNMLSKENLKEFEDAGIPVMIESLSDPEKNIDTMKRIAQVMDKEERSEKLISFIEKYQDLVLEKTSGLTTDSKPKIFFEWAGRPYYTVSNGTSSDTLIGYAGGINIAKDLGNKTSKYPTVSAEWVIETDPDVIVQTRSSDKPFSKSELAEFQKSIVSRPELQDVTAIKSGRVYVISGEIRYGVRSIISELYLAKWLHPDLFKDVDPEAVHKELVREFYGTNLDEAYAYPTDS